MLYKNPLSLALAAFFVSLALIIAHYSLPIATSAPSENSAPLLIQWANPTPEPQHIHLTTNQNAYILCGGTPSTSTSAREAEPANQPPNTIRLTTNGSDSWFIECLPPQ